MAEEEKEKEKTPEEKPTKVNEEKSKVTSFLWILLVSIIAIVGAYSWTTYDYKTRQQKIIDAQNNQLSKLDSIMGSFYTQSMQLSKDTAYYKVLLDSVAKSENIQTYADSIVKSVISAAIRTQNNRELTEQLRRDSIFVHTQIGQIQNDTKNQLSLEFNKLQNEYYTLQLWGGILTIVFLIFTFYSLFKTDDLVKQGHEGLEKLNEQREKAIELNIKSKSEYDEFKVKISTLESNINQIDKDKNKQQKELQTIQNEISIQNEQLAFNLRLKKQYEDLLDDITRAKQSVLDLETKMKEAKIDKTIEVEETTTSADDQVGNSENVDKLDDDISESDTEISTETNPIK